METLVALDEPKSRVRDRVPGSIEPLVSCNADAMERYDAPGHVSGRSPFAEMGSRPGEVGGAALLGASSEGEDAVEIRVGCDLQVRRRVCDLIEDVGFAG